MSRLISGLLVSSPLLLSLAACASSPAGHSGNSNTPAPSGSTSSTNTSSACNADAAKAAVGKQATPEVVEQARNDAGAKTARVLKPGQVVTMEYLADRLNVNAGAGSVVAGLTCG